MPYDRGGLQMPSLQWYYWAVQLRSPMFYFVTQSPPAWVYVEQASISKLPLNLYLYSADFQKKTTTTNPFLKNLYGSKLTDILVIQPPSLNFHPFGVMPKKTSKKTPF